MVHTVIFDLDGTLYDYDKAHTAGFEALSRYALETLGIQPVPFRILHREAMAEQERRVGFPCGSIHNRMIRYQIILEMAGKPISHALKMTGLYWDAFLRTAVPYPGAGDCLRTLRSAGYRVGIGTNMTTDYQFAKLDRLGLLDQIDFLLSSEEAGIEKPDPQFFVRCVEKAGCPMSACVFVGDNPVLDVAGAMSAGLRAVWFRPEADGAAQDAQGGTADGAAQDAQGGTADGAAQDAKGGTADEAAKDAQGGTADGTELPPTSLFYLRQEVPPEAEAAPQISSLAQLPALLAGL